ncbi:acyltransferase family-domain-containing protein [Blyttiomyces helicus]|uniref:Acyltransferase family-domain-containing protein n=1 Tax=Blyttiomyces helicus TaxID=388810 RepID=A0A4P9WJA9_9FUNG|nr:acyltransferase family-domain-containing protein [Blyttiomyces helicus]|eukprot:RKO92135.1 acyltransferase family-domain-containing protein [Blyttiomyces helicus]
MDLSLSRSQMRMNGSPQNSTIFDSEAPSLPLPTTSARGVKPGALVDVDLHKDHPSAKPSAAHAQKLDWVDGLRGFACWQVANSHCLGQLLNGVEWHVSTLIQPFPNSPATLSPTQEVLAGHNSVMLFFILSGRVLLNGFLKRRDPSYVASGAFRRPLRLGLPIYAGLLLHIFFTRIGVYHINTFASDKLQAYGVSNWFKYPEDMDIHHPAMQSVGGFLWSVPRMFLYHQLVPYPNRVQWTLPYEMEQSYYLFALVIFASFIGSRRWIFYFLATFMSWWMTTWSYPFFVGLIIADAAVSGHLTSIRSSRAWRYLHPFLLTFTASLWILSSMPEVNTELKRLENTLLHSWLPDPDWNAGGNIGFYDSSQLPFWKPDNVIFIHALTVILSIETTPVLQAVFSTRPMLFLGKISYMLYLFHPLFHATVPSLVMYLTIDYLPYSVAIVLAYLVNMAVIIPFSWLMYELFDMPSVRAAKWIVDKLFKDPWGFHAFAGCVRAAIALPKRVVRAAPVAVLRVLVAFPIVLLRAGRVLVARWTAKAGYAGL